MLCNLVLAHHLLGDDSTALQIATNAHEAAKSIRTGAYLWQVDDSGEWAVTHVLPQIWVAQLGAFIEQGLGTLGHWSHFTKAASLTPGPS